MSAKIYIIEDEPVMRQSLADLLSQSGYETDTLDFEAQPSRRDLETITEQILAAKPNLLLLDINLPRSKRRTAPEDSPCLLRTSGHHGHEQ